MSSIASIENSTKCNRCGEELIAPAWIGYVGTEEIRNFLVLLEMRQHV